MQKMKGYVNWSKSMVLIGNKSVNILKVCLFNYLGRTSKQIKEHYFNFLKPDIKKEDWTI